MLLPINWVKDYVEIDMESRELADKLTMTGSNAEEVITLREDITNVVVGKILSVEPHPNADKLVVCKVDVGTETIQILQVPAMLLLVNWFLLPFTALNCQEV